MELQSLSPNAALQDIIRNFKCLQAKLEKLHWWRWFCSDTTAAWRLSSHQDSVFIFTDNLHSCSHEKNPIDGWNKLLHKLVWSSADVKVFNTWFLIQYVLLNGPRRLLFSLFSAAETLRSPWMLCSSVSWLRWDQTAYSRVFCSRQVMMKRTHFYESLNLFNHLLVLCNVWCKWFENKNKVLF